MIMEDRCICCGEVIPEGRMICPICEVKVLEKKSEEEKKKHLKVKKKIKNKP